MQLNMFGSDVGLPLQGKAIQNLKKSLYGAFSNRKLLCQTIVQIPGTPTYKYSLKSYHPLA